MNLADILSDHDFGLRMRFEKRDVASFLMPGESHSEVNQTVTLDEVWFRIEEQSLVSLPKSGGILFGIKLVILPLREIMADPAARQGLMRALRTMPEPMAEYKGIAPARERLLALMESA